MDGDFTDYKPGYYTVEFSQADDFRNKDKSLADLAKWGTAYAIKFKGDAGTYYWSSRTQPEEDQRVYGHVEPSKSGKSMNFRRDEDPNKGSSMSSGSPSYPNSPSEGKKDGFNPQRDISDMPYRVWKDMLPYMDTQGLVKNSEYNREFNEFVMAQADELLVMIDKVRGSASAVPTPSLPIKEVSAPLGRPATESLSLGDQFREIEQHGEYTG